MQESFLKLRKYKKKEIWFELY